MGGFTAHTKTTKASVITAEKSGELLKQIVPDIQNTARLVQEIANASMEQNSGTRQINSAVNQLNTVSQQNASSAEELSAGAEQLSSQAEQLKDAISFFNTGQEKIISKNKNYKKIAADFNKLSEKSKGARIDLKNNERFDDDFQSY